MRKMFLLFAFFSIGCTEAKAQDLPEHFMDENPPAPYCGDRSIRPEGVLLQVMPIPQECQQWCWAAAITMVANYYQRPVSECQLATIRISNSGFQCCNFSACMFAPCDQPAQENEMSAILIAVVGLYGDYAMRPLTERELQTELSNGRPVIVGYRGPFSGHVAVIMGFSPANPDIGLPFATYRVVDPWPAFGVLDLAYMQIRMGPSPDGGTPWNRSWYHMSPRRDHCNVLFDPSCGCEN